MEDFHGYAARGKLFAEHADLVIQTGENEAVAIRQFPCETCCQNLRTSDIQTMQHLANDGAVVASWGYRLNHDAPPTGTATVCGDGVCSVGSFRY